MYMFTVLPIASQEAGNKNLCELGLFHILFCYAQQNATNIMYSIKQMYHNYVNMLKTYC